MAPKGTVAVRFVGDVTGLKRSIGDAESGLAGMGKTLTRTLTPAAIGLGAVFKTAFDEFDQGADAMRASTGATGKALDDLVKSMKNVGGQVTQPLSEVGKVMGDLHTRTGLTGESLETLTKQLLDLERVGNAASSETVTRVFGDWGIAAEDSAAALDKLFRASQATGPSVDRLGQLIVQYGAPLRQLGFSFEESATMLGKFEKEGVNTELVMGSMRIALGKMARAGEDAQSTFERVVDEIKNAGSASEANALALELFGARAGPDMAAAIREGRFELGELVAQVTSGGETIAKAAKDTEDWGDRLKMLTNRIQGTIGPYGEMGMAVAGLAAGLGPAIQGVSKMTDFLKNNALAVGGVTAGLGLAALAVHSFQQSKERARRVVQEFTTAMEADSGAIGENTEALLLNKLQSMDLLDELVAAGLTVKDVTAAVNDETGARERLQEALLAQGANVTFLNSQLGSLFTSTNKAREAVEAKAKATRGYTGDLNAVPDRIDTHIALDARDAEATVDRVLWKMSNLPREQRVRIIFEADERDLQRLQNQASLRQTVRAGG